MTNIKKIENAYWKVVMQNIDTTFRVAIFSKIEHTLVSEALYDSYATADTDFTYLAKNLLS